jgi:CBS domain containing-hemolysin-like protein
VPIVHIYANGDTFSGSSEQYVRKIQKNDKIVGVVTIEDLFEQLIGQEIEDETDNL